MPTSEVIVPRKRSFLRVWFPLAVVSLTALAITGLWTWPGPDLERVWRVVGTMQALMVAALLLGIWIVAFSGLRWWIRGGILLVALAAGLTVREVKFTGDLVPTFRFYWERSPDDILEAHRRHQAVATSPSVTAPAAELDFPEFRGKLRDGIVNGPVLARDWKTKPPRLKWRQPVGGGYASFAIAGDSAVTIEQRRLQEAIVCYDTATGQERWTHSYDARHTQALGGEGPRATPTIAGNDVFSLGAQGRLVCLDLKSGAVKWSVNILDNNTNVTWGMSGSPLVFDQVVVVNPGTQRVTSAGRALVAYNRTSGDETWHAGNTRAGYSSPMLATLCGHRLILLFDGEGLAGYDAATGDEFWRLDWETQQGINVAMPLVLPDNQVFITSGYGVGCALVRVSEAAGKWSVEPVWQNKALRSRFSNPVYHQGFIYGLDEGILVCINAITGARQWKDGRYDHGQLLLTGDLLLILSEFGKLALVEANPQAYRELGTFPVLEGKTWNHVALAGGLAFVRNHLEMACYDLRE